MSRNIMPYADPYTKLPITTAVHVMGVDLDINGYRAFGCLLEEMKNLNN